MHRLLAFLVDYVLILIYLVVVFVVSVFLFPSVQNLFQGSLVVAQLTGFLIITFPVLLYFIICDSQLVGQTLGKRKIGIRVVTLHGESLTVPHSIMRMILKFLLPWELSHFFVFRLANLGDENVPLHITIIGILIYAIVFAYILTTLFTKKKQSLYDLICRTQVIRVNVKA